MIFEPRRILISWRPEDIKGTESVLTTMEWVSLLSRKLKHAGIDAQKRPIEVIYKGKAGDNIAVNERDIRSYTDFVAVYSDDYCDKCDEEANQQGSNELVDALKRLQDMSPGKPLAENAHNMPNDNFNLWVAPISKGRFRNAIVGGQKPWSQRAWHFLMQEGQAFTLVKRDLQYDSEIATMVAEPIIRHCGCGPACQKFLTDASLEITNSPPPLLSRLFKAFGRRP